ncbi:LADA_0D10198g1_1 [Lachancea dasiensis]|uniref:LADA_0D10198g1_1 n=1 Tax=Lachancea dasiensis TaxID=1072105 RepID=A0A1G4J810_9SACH|nr:LADA_0D10198g1_1 [Lachancea dasiensis]
MDRLEALLPGYFTTDVATEDLSSQRTQRLRKIKSRGKQILKWSKLQVSSGPIGAMRKMSHSSGSGCSAGASSLEANPRQAETAADEDTRTVLHLYKFLKTTLDEFGNSSSSDAMPALQSTTDVLLSDSVVELESRSISHVGSESDVVTMVDSHSLEAPQVKRFKQLWNDHFHNCSPSVVVNSTGASYNSSAATLVSSSSSDGGENQKTISLDSSGADLDKVADIRISSSYSTSSTEQFLQDLESLDEKINILIDDPQKVSASIKFHNYSKALETGMDRHLHYYELPFPWRENRFIVHGYRFYNSYSKSLLSIINWYGWHNETVNIWTHLLGAIYFGYVLLKSFPGTAVYQSDLVPPAAKAMAFIFLFAGMECFIFSVIWHTFNGICDLTARSKCACVDYTGITVLITASILTTEAVTLSGDPSSPYTWPFLFYTTATAALGAIGFYMNWSPKFDRPESRPLRIASYILLASFGIISYAHSRILHPSTNPNLIMPILSKSLVWYLIGVVFYGTFIPERWRSDLQVADNIPTEEQLTTDLDIITKHRHIHFRDQPALHQHSQGHSPQRTFFSLWWVDYFCCSHTLWHIFVLLGVYGHYTAMLEMFELRWLVS